MLVPNNKSEEIVRSVILRNDLIICVGGSGFRSDDATPEAMKECVIYPAVTLQHLFVSQSLNHGFDEPFR